jgi:hypothetical protein
MMLYSILLVAGQGGGAGTRVTEPHSTHTLGCQARVHDVVLDSPLSQARAAVQTAAHALLTCKKAEVEAREMLASDAEDEYAKELLAARTSEQVSVKSSA